MIYRNLFSIFSRNHLQIILLKTRLKNQFSIFNFRYSTFFFSRLIFLLAFLVSLLSCSDHAVTDQTVIAEIGNQKITALDFQIAYELAGPGEKRTNNNITLKKEDYLHKMADKKLLAIAGLERNLHQKDDVQRLLKWYEKQETIRELYKQVVSGQVEVQEAEVREAYVLLNQRLLLRQLLFQSGEAAYGVYQRILSGDSFEQVALETAKSERELQHILAVKEFKWGELDERLEAAAYGLNHLQTSAPVKSEAGYHLLQLVDRKENLILTESGFAERQHYVETIIRRRKEAVLAKAYIKNLMADKRLHANGPILLKLTQRAQAILREKQLEKPVPTFAQARMVRPHLQGLMDETLAVFEGGLWTVGEFFDRLAEMHPQHRPDLTDPGKLQLDLAMMVRDDFLAEEAYSHNFQQNEAVRNEVRRITEEIVAKKMRRSLLDTTQVSAAEISQFYTENIVRYQVPEMVNIREIMVRSKKLADSLYAVIQSGGDIAELARNFSVRQWAAKKDGELGYFAGNAFGTVGRAAFRLAVGQLSEPVPVKLDTVTVGYSVFRVIDRKPLVTPSLQDVYDRVAQNALKEKKQQVLSAFLETVKTDHPVSLNESALAHIKTSDELGTGRPMDLIKLTRLR